MGRPGVVVSSVAALVFSAACPAPRAPAAGRNAMECRAEIVQRSPLKARFELINPSSAAQSLWVPRVLLPLGAFVAVELHDAAGAIVWETDPPKFHPKLDPADAGSYVELAPGQAHGVDLALDAVKLGTGAHTLVLRYDNLQYRGFTGHPLGEQRCSTTVPVPEA